MMGLRLILAAVVCFALPGTSESATNRLSPAATDSVITGFWRNKAFGISAETVSTQDYETGFGCAGMFKVDIPRTIFSSSTSLHFWGASKEIDDLSVLGVTESIIYTIPMASEVEWFGGFSSGYYFCHKRLVNQITGKDKIVKSFFPVFFITFGGMREIDRKRHVYVRCTYGPTDIGDEFHIGVGILFQPGRFSSPDE